MGELSAIINLNRLHSTNGLLLSSALTAFLAITLWNYLKPRKSVETKNAVIVITGCDSGLGYSLALHFQELGFNVFAGVLSLQSVGAKSLVKMGGEMRRITVYELDVTSIGSLKNSVSMVSTLLENNSDYYLHAIVNNAGVMVFGEFEWQTDDLMHQQINVNLVGAMHFTKMYLPLLRKYKGRIINVSSHCALAGLPGLSVYAATKSGLSGWNDSLRVECAKYGVKVISTIPGSFFNQSNILTKQAKYADKMKSAMNSEAVEFYGDYFNQYQQYVSGFSTDMSLHRIQDSKLYEIFTDALVSTNPNSCYINSPFRYSLYHFMFRIFPTSIRDCLIERFVSMPSYKK